ncbi:hypothetical protein EI546_10295 [Aequorivita sp. H23M31]|uniref:Uncharacterized protein n=1 Tax=Aequorivita ciconiae TaxID=2494375 RepID=A0A410G4A1_9FLAO|nr:hypothetical protein [Aequorivita sp. H23M31]QAA82086.1 hypothetical protein EI546_10295 [Aequorivita sp. H23M31]
MKRKIVYIIALVFLVAIGKNFIGLIGVNIWGYNEIWQNKRSHQSDVPYEDYLAAEQYQYCYQPKIDSLLEVNPKLAIQYIDKVMAIYPDEYFLELYQGIGYYKIDSFEIAYKKFQKSMKKNGKEYPRALQYSGWALVKLEMYDEALLEFRKASEYHSDYNFDMATVFELKKDLPNAIKYYRKEIEHLKKINALAYYKEITQLEKKIANLKKTP